MTTKKRVNLSNLMANSREVIGSHPELPTDVVMAFENMTKVFQILLEELGLNSTNSSKPPSTDKNFFPKTKQSKSSIKPGGQVGHVGARLEPVANPTRIEFIKVDRSGLPSGKWRLKGFKKRQVIDVEVTMVVTEYQVEVLINQHGDIVEAKFPSGVTEQVQYGSSVRATSVYLSQSQLIPQARVQELFQTQFSLSLTKGSVNNFNNYAAHQLREWGFKEWLQTTALKSPLLHADETGTKVNLSKYWIHCLSNEKISYFHVDAKRGAKAHEGMGVFDTYQGTIVHDFWKVYFKYLCKHALCNAHHLRELERAFEMDGQQWARKIAKLLIKIKKEVEKNKQELSDQRSKYFVEKFRKLLCDGMTECPADDSLKTFKKSRNLLERLLAYEEETLRFMSDTTVPFTNNNAEQALRMNKVQQKISGCFRSIRGAEDYCLIRSYISTSRKNGVEPMDALTKLFNNIKPDFMN